MIGSLILISGRTGAAGKTTLMRAAAASINGLEILQTTTTRPIREGEVSGQEYVFVTDVEYERLRRAAPEWDHLEYHGYKYGADSAAVKAMLRQGTSLVCTVTPDKDEIVMMERAYGVKAKTIWLDVPADIATARVAADAVRASRAEDTTAQRYFQHTFTPAGDIAVDSCTFTDFVRTLL